MNRKTFIVLAIVLLAIIVAAAAFFYLRPHSVVLTAEPSSVAATEKVTFTASAKASGYDSYTLTFGDGESTSDTEDTYKNSDDLFPITHIYSTPGTYTVELVGFGTNKNCSADMPCAPVIDTVASTTVTVLSTTVTGTSHQ